MLNLLLQTNFALHDLNQNEFFVQQTVQLIVGLPNYLLFSFSLYLAGLLGMVLNYKNFLITMMAVEMMYLGVISSFVLYASTCHDFRGYVYALLILILAACESAIGLGLLIVLYRFDRTIDFDDYQNLGG